MIDDLAGRLTGGDDAREGALAVQRLEHLDDRCRVVQRRVHHLFAVAEDVVFVIAWLVHQHDIDTQGLGAVNRGRTTTNDCNTLVHANFLFE